MKIDRCPRQTYGKLLPWLLAAGLSLCGGCYDSEDIDHRLLVSQMGLDAASNQNQDGSSPAVHGWNTARDQNQDGSRPRVSPSLAQGPAAQGRDSAGPRIELTLRIPLIGSVQQVGGQNAAAQKNYLIRSTLAPDVFPGMIRLQQRETNTLFVGQCRAIIFGEALARRGIAPVLDYFDRRPTFPPSTFVMVGRPTAKALLQVDWPAQQGDGQNIRWFFSNRLNKNFGVKKWRLSRDVIDPLRDPVIPIVTPSDENSTIRMTGMAVFRGDRMVGELDTVEAMLYGLLRDAHQGARLVIPEPGFRPATFILVTGTERLRVGGGAERPRFRLQLNLRGYLAELDDRLTPLDLDRVRRLERQSAVYLSRKLESLLRKLQSLESDPLDLGNQLRIRHPRWFTPERWQEAYRRAEFGVSVHFFIERLGVSR